MGINILQIRLGPSMRFFTRHITEMRCPMALDSYFPFQSPLKYTCMGWPNSKRNRPSCLTLRVEHRSHLRSANRSTTPSALGSYEALKKPNHLIAIKNRREQSMVKHPNFVFHRRVKVGKHRFVTYRLDVSQSNCI